MPPSMSPFFTKKQAAERLHCGTRTVERLIAEGKLRPAGAKGQRVLIPIEEQVRYEEELRRRGLTRSIDASEPIAAKPKSKKRSSKPSSSGSNLTLGARV